MWPYLQGEVEGSDIEEKRKVGENSRRTDFCKLLHTNRLFEPEKISPKLGVDLYG